MTLFIQPDKENNHQTKLPFQGFIPVTSCSYSDLETAFSIHPPETNFTKWKHSTINFYSQQLDVQSLMKDQEIILPEYKSQGLFWWRSMLTFYVIRPNYQTREWLRQHGNTAAQTAITTMLRSRECISIHVRHSDKGNEVDLLPLKAYMTKANEIRNMTGILNIYLMTDDQLVVNEARQEYGRNSTEREGGFEIHVQEMMRSNAGWKDDIKKGRVSPQESLKQFLIDLFSAVQCRYSIVTYSSNVGRLVGEIKYAMNNQDPKTTVFSLDYEWTMYP
ncbi:hypothetical protein BCR41DRAFT_423605 [Lobosporangium transversale]|uniref:Alpha-(1,6)-fucosyltransferase N- and catalytic domain-containing protein n=1 Tax=Lobosporangium transversale TaxID=64571 RepID=A0A1Y2GJI9_9FUNG|nr:hypothetical protein BCR41DRAFT_423605 [Lobosporangium transversale]ORZ11402.1 hypothetical protein BCR41DRAFT_423605 [Lobosporangium transversale]|eukprot:XP_021879717.1 hypothetical protein BCR41DRAFT_423605 [Lobosporangium transversale]